jgi:SAM-dependent methyltransferase
MLWWFLLAALVGGGEGAQATGDSQFQLVAAAERLANLPVPVLLDALEIQPGSVVLDLGAGVGLLTEGLVARVGPTGRVIATEIDAPLVARLQDLKARKKLTNLEVWQVQALGVDPAYAKARYDLVVLVGVYEFLVDPREFFRLFRPYLKPGGRLVIVHPKPYPALSVNRALDLSHLAQVLESEGESSPLLGALSKASLEGLRRGQPFEVGSYGLLIDELNRALADPGFTRAVLQYYTARDGMGLDGLLRDVEAHNRPLFRWALNRFAGAVYKPVDQLDSFEKKGVWIINWIILASRYAKPDEIMSGYVIREDPLLSPLDVKKDLLECGFKYLGLDGSLHFYDILKFVSEEPAR